MQSKRPWGVARAVVAIVAFAILAVPAPAADSTKPAGLRTPAVPSLVQPARGTAFQFLPAFHWKRSARATSYEFELAADSGFNSPVLGRGKDSFTTRNLRATLPEAVPNGTYFWRVRALDEKNRPSKWSPGRKVVRAWSAAPTLQSPPRDEVISYPSETLTLAWAPVDFAAQYEVRIATDAKLSSLVALSTRGAKPIETGATALTPAATLAQGTYYWGVTPIDAQGHKGAPSKVSSFRWEWPSATLPVIADLAAETEVDAYRFSWTQVPGASRYEVEINSSPEFSAGSRICCTTPTTGLSLTPTDNLPNNAYYWRVRPIDVDGNVGQWSRGPDFVKSFGAASPPIRNLHLRNHLWDVTTTGARTGTPIVTWDPVPGAASYQVQVGTWSGTVCTYGIWDVKTATNAWTPLGHGKGGLPYPADNVAVNHDGTKALVDGTRYCVRVRARADRDQTHAEVVGSFVELQASFAQPWAFEFDGAVNVGAPPCTGCSTSGFLGSSDYLLPQTGLTTARMPVFTWKPVDAPGGADPASYWIIVARDPAFTKLVDYAFTQVPAYAPRGASGPQTYPGEQTVYYWAVLPAPTLNGLGAQGNPLLASAPQFRKLSAQPMPGEVGDPNGQPSFHWSLAEGARTYTLQVSADASFANPFETVTTAGLSFTTSQSYPAGTLLRWRVRANDEMDAGLAWSPVGTFTRSLPAPSATTTNRAKGDSIPTWTWNRVPGAIGYDMLAEEPDGDQTEVNGSRQTAFTATSLTGTGKFRWQVRALFPTSGSSSTPGPWGALTEFTRTIGEPVGARGVVTKDGQVLMSWNAKSGAKHYSVEVSEQRSFKTVIEKVKVDGTQFAPLLLKRGWDDGGALWWRVAAIDADNNTGASSAQKLTLAKAFGVTVRGALSAMRAGELTVTVKWRGKAVNGATVKIAGPGAETRRVRTNGKGEAKLRVTPTKKGAALEVRITKTGYQLNRAKVTVR